MTIRWLMWYFCDRRLFPSYFDRLLAIQFFSDCDIPSQSKKNRSIFFVIAGGNEAMLIRQWSFYSQLMFDRSDHEHSKWSIVSILLRSPIAIKLYRSGLVLVPPCDRVEWFLSRFCVASDPRGSESGFPWSCVGRRFVYWESKLFKAVVSR